MKRTDAAAVTAAAFFCADPLFVRLQKNIVRLPWKIPRQNADSPLAVSVYFCRRHTILQEYVFQLAFLFAMSYDKSILFQKREVT